MAVCEYCGTEIKDGMESCPNCGKKIEESDNFFKPDASLEEEMYNIFDAPEEYDLDSLLSKEFASVELPETASENLHSVASENSAEEIEDYFNFDELLPVAEPEKPEEESEVEFPEVEETDFLALDELFQDMDEKESSQTVTEEPEQIDKGLEELLAVSDAEQQKESKKDKKVKQKKEKVSLFKSLFGNVPVDPSKVKPEPNPEEIAQKKAKKAEEKKAKAEGKKLAAEEKKQIAQKNKEEKARQKALAKEEKKARKLQEAKQILEDMQETRINRLGATIVLAFFVVCAIVLLSGSELFSYAVSIGNAESNFNKAYNNDTCYYTEAYNDIYGLDIRSEDQVLSDKIMTVMFVNKELNSYNSYMSMENYTSALHSLLLGMYRYGKYYEQAIPLGIDKDMDFVRTQILKELEATFGVSEDEAEVLRSMLEEAGTGGMSSAFGTEVHEVNPEKARKYTQKLNEIVKDAKESGLIE